MLLLLKVALEIIERVSKELYKLIEFGVGSAVNLGDAHDIGKKPWALSADAAVVDF